MLSAIFRQLLFFVSFVSCTFKVVLSTCVSPEFSCRCLTDLIHISQIIEQSEKRFEDQLEGLVNLVAEVLPAALTQPKPEEQIEENEEMADGEKTEHEGQAVEAEQIHKDEN